MEGLKAEVEGVEKELALAITFLISAFTNHKKQCYTLQERENPKKHNRAPLIKKCPSFYYNCISLEVQRY